MSYSDEFPLLEGVGLYASDISGDGNCLFHALSDQLYGHENNHSEIREKVVRHMRDNASYFKLFLDVGPTRRAPKRKAASNNNGKKAAVTAALPSEGAIDVAFAQHLNRMARSGVYGDNMEISAFAREYGCDVKIYQRDFAYVVTGGEGGDHEGRGDSGKAGEKKVLHIAYHTETWEHYSSVRNRDGPHAGPPNVSPVPLAEEGRKEQEKKLANSSYVQPWMVETVTSSLPCLVDSRRIREALEEAKGNIDVAVSKLLDAEEGEQDGEDEQQQKGESEKEYVDKSKDAKKKEKVDVIREEGGEEKEAEKMDAQGSPKTQDNADKVNDLSEDTNGAKTPKRPTTKVVTRKQQPRKETARERKARQKAAAKQRKKENAPGNKDAELEKGTAVITTGIKELHV